MTKREVFPVCWVRMSAYMHPWIIAIFGTDAKFDGATVVDLRPIRGVEEVLLQPFIINSKAELLNNVSYSDQLMRMIHAMQILGQNVVNEEFGISNVDVSAFLPVSMPDIVRASGLNRVWNCTMQMSSSAGARLALLVADEFWRSIYRHSIHFRKTCEMEEQPYSVQRMVEAFMTTYKIDTRYQDQIVRVFYRKSAKNFFNNC